MNTSKSEQISEREIIVANNLSELFDGKEPTQKEIIERLRKLKEGYASGRNEATASGVRVNALVR